MGIGPIHIPIFIGTEGLSNLSRLHSLDLKDLQKSLLAEIFRMHFMQERGNLGFHLEREILIVKTILTETFPICVNTCIILVYHGLTNISMWAYFKA